MSWGCKLFNNEQYARDFMEGKIYFSSAGRFSQETDSQRKYTEGRTKIYTKPLYINGECFNVPYETSCLEIDRVPIFCFTALDACSVNYIEGKFVYDPPEELKEMGQYLVLFNIDELYRLLSNGIKNSGYGLIGKKVVYFDFEKLRDDSWLAEIHNQYDCLFMHDIKHKSQNEFRFILTHKLLEDNENSTIIDVGDWRIAPKLTILIKEK